MIDRTEFGAWLRLLETPGVGRATARTLLTAFGSPEAVLDASDADRRKLVEPAVAAALRTVPAGWAERVELGWRWLDGATEFVRAIVPLGDPRYPQTLLDAPDPPLLLYAQGRIELLAAPSVAVVGSRNPTPQGAENAREFSSQLADAGWTIVSGMALGIDAAAHLGALEAPGAAGTIAVVGTGLDIVYPRRHLALARRIAAEGLVLSEYPIGAPSLPAHFPQRNRIIAGLTRGTLVVEAALKSGSLITARLANEAGREVFAIPGSIHSLLARGCHALIRQGARLVESADEILDELGTLRLAGQPAAAARTAPDGEADDEVSGEVGGDSLLQALGHDPVTLDALVDRTGRSASELAADLLSLELDGRVDRLPGQRFQRRGPA